MSDSQSVDSPAASEPANSESELEPAEPSVSESYYTFRGLPLAPAGPAFPPPVVYPAHVDALVAALENRKSFFWVVLRGDVPGVFKSP